MGKSLAELLKVQPASFHKHSSFPRLVARLNQSPALRRAALGKTAFRLLHQARLKPENLENLYRTYRLPRDPFFPLFLLMKREIAERKQEAKREKAAAIAEIVNGLPENIRGFIAFLAKLEGGINPKRPVWTENLYPKTKKRAKEFAAFTTADWIVFFGTYLELLRRSYVNESRMRPMEPEKLLACMALGCFPDPVSLEWPSAEEIKTKYRKLCKTLHPDSGGDPGLFRMVSLARETLLPLLENPGEENLKK